MRFELIIDAETAALVDNPQCELARILDELSVVPELFTDGEAHNVRDSNGNTVGYYELTID